MSITASRTRGSANRIAVGAAVAALLVTPLPVVGSHGSTAHGPSRTLLLTLTGSQSLTQLADGVAALGGTVLDSLTLADSLLVRLPSGAGLPAGAAEVPDVPMRANSTRTAYDAHVPTYRQTIGLADTDRRLGGGVTVALVDTGVDPAAEGLAGVRHVNVTKSPAGDGLGHGTFLAGIIAGNGIFPGVAPAAQLVDVQVADAEGDTSLSKVLKGLQAAQDAGADVVSLSLSTDDPLPPGFDPLSRALESLWAGGVTVVTAAGNDGPDAGTVGSPGNDPMLLAIGALDEAATAVRADDGVAEFSARDSDGGKPDLVAPGVSLVSTAAVGSQAAIQNPESLLGNGYMRGSGTSMAAAVVSGAAAAVLGVNGSLRPDQVKKLLKGTAYSAAGLGTGAGEGGLDLAAALAAAKSTPGTANDPGEPGAWGPAEGDANSWQAFAVAWRAGDRTAALSAWRGLSPRTRIWAARAWAISVVSSGVAVDSTEFVARAWAARAWAAEDWLARAWAARNWTARAWADGDWMARTWAARAWADEQWLARAWAARAWASDDWAARAWAARAWAGYDWSVQAWTARAWATWAWAARAWANDGWGARAWAARAWATPTADDPATARAWAARAWATPTTDDPATARAWAARAWATDTSA